MTTGTQDYDPDATLAQIRQYRQLNRDTPVTAAEIYLGGKMAESMATALPDIPTALIGRILLCAASHLQGAAEFGVKPESAVHAAAIAADTLIGQTETS